MFVVLYYFWQDNCSKKTKKSYINSLQFTKKCFIYLPLTIDLQTYNDFINNDFLIVFVSSDDISMAAF